MESQPQVASSAKSNSSKKPQLQHWDISVIQKLFRNSFFLLKDIVLRDYAAASLVLIGDNAIEPLVSFLHDPDLSKVGKESERVLAFASTRLTASSALKKVARETLDKLGWEPEKEEVESQKETEYTDTNECVRTRGSIWHIW